MPIKPRVLILPVKRIYFEAILERKKLKEYRLENAYWTKRLEGRAYDRIEMTLGYPSAQDRERRLLLPWNGYVRETISHPHFGPAPVAVFSIFVDVLQKIEVEI